MRDYIVRRILLMLPTLFGITILTFVIINLAPGGPVEQRIQQMRFGGAGGEGAAKANVEVNSEIVEALKKQYGLDKPLLTRYGIWLKRIATLDFGDSFTFEEPVMDVIVRKFPVSLQFGLASFILVYLICIPLGIMMALKENTWFDRAAGVILGIMYSIPSFMLAILLVVFFAGGTFVDWFPIGGISSDGYEDLSLLGKIWDRIYHFLLPGLCYMIGSFTTLSLLMRNSLLEELKKDYIRTARAKGLPDGPIYFKHGLRNAFIPIATGLGSFLSIFFAGSILIEQIFQLDGIGLLTWTSLRARDYNVIMALTFLQSLLMLLGNLFSDLIYVWVDPRIDYT
jgi:microcin C transport system permease protein